MLKSTYDVKEGVDYRKYLVDVVSGASSAPWEWFAAPRLTIFAHFVKQLPVGRHPPPQPAMTMTTITSISVRLRRKENAAAQ